MNNKKQYYEVIAPLIKEGLLREIYNTKDISVLNVAEEIYMINLINDNVKRNELVVGFLATDSIVDYISNGTEYYYDYYNDYKDKLVKVAFADYFINNIKKYKTNTLNNGPSKFINYEMEERLANKMKERGKM